MYEYTIVEYFGPFGGQGGYGSITKSGIHRRSVAKAIANAKRGQFTTTINNGGGGVPILGEVILTKNGKVLLRKYL
jgi:hypothetical protein